MESCGEKRVACENATSSWGLAEPLMVCAKASFAVGAALLGGWPLLELSFALCESLVDLSLWSSFALSKCKCQSLVLAFLWPCRTSLPLKVMTRSLFVKCASQSASHNVAMEMRLWSLRPGTTCASRAAFGSFSVGSSPMCVEVIISPDAVVIWSGSSACRTLRSLAPTT